MSTDELSQRTPTHGRFTSEVMAGGSVVEKPDDELVGGLRGAMGVIGVLALIAVLGLFSIWWLLFVVGVLIAIFLHETGHFVTARWTGMKATQFFIGFGPRLWSFRRGETEYGVRALPLGAFVRIIGMNNMDEVEPGDETRTYRSKSYPKRLLVISAGSIMHMIIAVLLLFIVYVADGELVERDGAAIPAASPGAVADPVVSGAALAAGLEAEDVIIAIDGVAVGDSTELGRVVRTHQPGETVTITALRGGATVDTANTLELDATLGSSLDVDGELIGVDELVRTVSSTDEAVSEAGGGVDAAQLSALLERHDVGDTVSAIFAVGVDGAGEQVTRVVPADVVRMDDGTLALEGTALLGVSTRSNTEIIEHSVSAAAVNAVTDILPTSWEMTKGAVQVLNPVNIVTHLAGTNDDLATRPTTLVGVTGLSDDVGESQGFIGILFLLAVLNVFVGVFNMFPLLPLDGGHAAIATYERLRERGGQRYYADVAKMMPFAMAVMTVLLFLFMSGLYLDITDPVG